MFGTFYRFADRIFPDALTMPLDELIAIYVIGVSASLAVVFWLVRGILRSAKENRAQAKRREMRIAAIVRAQQDAQDRRTFELAKYGTTSSNR